jgi:hypothetical protein
MRKTVIPLLRALPSAADIVRCRLCNELVFMGEVCRTDDERNECPSRRQLEEAAA